LLRRPRACTDALRVSPRHLEADCGEIRQQLAVLSRGALRCGLLADHVEHCEGCRRFAAEVRRQHAGLGVLLAVVASPALKHSTLTAAAAAAGGGTAATPGDVDEARPWDGRHPPR
jgi:hypothetical protein